MKYQLTAHQHEILVCDTGADQPDPHKNGDYYGTEIGDQLRAGHDLEVTHAVLEMVDDLVDHDADLNDKRVYTHLKVMLYRTSALAPISEYLLR